MKEEGLVGKEERTFHVLRNLSYTETEKKDSINYCPGMAVQFHRNHQSFKAGSTYDVAGIGKDGKVLLKSSKNGELAPLPFEQCRKFQVCQKEKISIAEGDIIRVTGNGKAADGRTLNNGESHTVKSFTEDGHIRLSNGKVMEKDYRSFALGYYRTSHASQGKDAHDVFIAQSSTSFSASNEKQFYVSVSRGVERCFVYTDDKEALKWAASQQADRMSADKVASTSKDKSLWLIARNAFQQQQLEQYRKDMEHFHQPEPSKEQTYEPDLPVLPSRSGKEIHIDI